MSPSYLLVQGTGLLWVSNTESDVFRLGKTARCITSGRAVVLRARFYGAVTLATPSLPEDFKKIPLSHDRCVLASVRARQA